MRVLIRKCGDIEVYEHGEDVVTLDADDPLAILPVFRAYVEFEEGLTPFHLMKALKPWSIVLSEAGWLDFDAWSIAMEKPLLKEVSTPDEERLMGIELHPDISIQSRRRRGGGDKDAELFVNWRPLGRYAVPHADVSGRVVETCSISFVDPREIGHLPISIVEKAPVIEMGGSGKGGHLPDKSYKCGPTFFDTVVLGFLDDISFHGSPERTQDIADNVKDIFAQIKDGTFSPET